MKKFYLLLYFTLFWSYVLIGQTTNDYRSVQDGDWTNFNTWERYNGSSWVSATAYPGLTTGNAETVTISDAVIFNNHGSCEYLVIATGGSLTYNDLGWPNLTVNHDVTINTGGALQANQTATSDHNQNMYIGGNLQIDGTLDGYHDNAGNEGCLYVEFTGATDNTLSGSGSCEIYNLTINKGSAMSNTLEVLMPVTLIDANSANTQKLSIDNGTLKLSTAQNWLPYWNNQTVTQSTACLWLNHADASIGWANTSGNANFNGDLILDAGSFSCPDRFNLQGSSSGNNQINGGTLSIGYNWDIEQDVSITGGSISVSGDMFADNDEADDYGDLTISGSPNISIGGIFRSYGSNASTSISGSPTITAGAVNMQGGITISGGDIDVSGDFLLEGSAPLTNQISGGDLYIGGNWDIERRMTVVGGTITVGGNLYADGNGTDEYGELIVDDGSITIGDGDDILQLTGNSGNDGTGGRMTVNGGTINVYGRMDVQDGTGTEVCYFTMTGGAVNIDPQHTVNLTGNNDIIYFGDNSEINITGGMLTIVDPWADKDAIYRDAIDIRGTTGSKNFSGSTISFGDGSSSANGDDTWPGHSIYIGSGGDDVRFGHIILNNPAGTGRGFIGRDNTNIYCEELTLTTANDSYQMTGKILDIQGNLLNNGTIDGNGSGSHIYLTGSNTQTCSGSGSMTNVDDLTINNSSATGVNTSAVLAATQIHMTDGHVSTSGSGGLVVEGTAVNDLDGYSNSNYVKGLIRRAIPSTAGGIVYDFPVGSATAYRLLELRDVYTTGSGSGYLTVMVSEPQSPAISGTAGTAMDDPLTLEDIYWQVSSNLNSVSFSVEPTIRLSYTAPTLPPYAIAQSNNDINGTYNSIGRVPGTGTIASTTFDLTGFAPNGDAYLVIGKIRPIQGTLTVGETGDIRNLTAIADTLRKNFVKGDVYFELLADYDETTETIPVRFDELQRVQLTDYVIIRPQSGVSGTTTRCLGATDDEAIIVLDNIEGLSFDGRPGGTGVSDWLVANTRVSNPGPVFAFSNDAKKDSLRYLTIQSDVANAAKGVIVFENPNIDGCDNHVIEYCNITGYTNTPRYAVYAGGLSGAEHDANTIDNCNIYDYFSSTSSTSGIYINDYNSNWTISNNKFYQTSARVFSGNYSYYAIYINDGNNHLIDGNTIGYANSSSTGFTDISGSSGEFTAIYYSGDDGTATSITNNVISGIKLNTSSTNTNNGFFNGIWLNDGDALIGSSGNGNIIGSSGNFADYPIQITNQSDGGQVIALFIDAANAIQVVDNEIGGFQILGDNDGWFIGIQTANNSNNADYTISDNTIGSSSQANSIAAGQTGYSNAVFDVYGVYNYQSSDYTFDNNLIQNITSYSTSGSGNSDFCGIYIRDDDNMDDFWITSNTVSNLTSYAGGTGTGENSILIGIYDESDNITTQLISGNTVHSLTLLNPDNRSVQAIGILALGNTTAGSSVTQNFVHSFNCVPEDGSYAGLYIGDGNFLVTNNMVRLGIDKDGNSISTGNAIWGINFAGADLADFYHNSVYIGGSGITSGSDTYAFYKAQTELSAIQNNIFVNARSNGSGSQKHVAYGLSFDDVVTSDYNIYYAPGTGGVIANFDGLDFNSLRAMQSYTNYKEMHSGEGDPVFEDPTGNAANVDLHLSSTNPTPAEGMGNPSYTLTNDFDGQLRSSFSAVDIGADAGNYNFNSTVDIFPPRFDYTGIDPQNCGISSVNLDVTISDQGTGVPISGTLRPMLYYRNKSMAWSTASSVYGNLQSGTGTNSVWRFSLTGLSDGTHYEYYIVAQDQASTPTLGYSQFDDDSPVHSDVQTVTTDPDAGVPIDVFTVCVYPKATYTVGNATDCPTCDFETLTGYGDFFFNMNAMIIDKDVTCLIVANTTEPADYAAEETTESPLGSNFNIRIQPNDASIKQLVSSNTINNAQIRLTGADRYTFEGQYNKDGNRWLQFIHNKNDQSVFQFVDDAQNDSLLYLSIQGSPELDPRGVIFIDTANVSGNDGLVIKRNEITDFAATPQNLIYARGSSTVSAASNSNIEISENYISDFKNNGIWVRPVGNGDNWNISANTMFNSYVSTEAQSAIRIESGEGHSINNNRIGGSADDNSGTWQNDGTEDFMPVYCDMASGSKSTINNNTIKNIQLSNTGWAGTMRGIRVESGWADINGNIIRNIEKLGRRNMYVISYNGTGGVSLSDNSISTITETDDFYGMYISPSSTSKITVSNNNITGITTGYTDGNSDTWGIYGEDADYEATDNRIGGNTVAEKIDVTGGDFRGIELNSSEVRGPISNNQILNVEVSHNREFRGLYIRDVFDSQVIYVENNLVDNITISNTGGNTLCYVYDLDDGELYFNNNTCGTATYGISNAGTNSTIGIYYHANENDGMMENNTITNISGNGNTYGFYTNENNRHSIHNNRITGISIINDISFTGIRVNQGNTVSVQGNQVDDIELTNTGSNTRFRGIWVSDGRASIGTSSANTIGHSSTANSITCSGIETTGMLLASSSMTTTENNLVANLTANSTASTTFATGIEVSGTGTATVKGNTIRDMSSSSSNTNNVGQIALQGFYLSGSSSSVIDSNLVYDLNAVGTAISHVAGISEAASEMVISRNKIYGLTHNGTAANRSVVGVILSQLNGGYLATNQIALQGNDDADYHGIWITSDDASASKKIYFNSVYIGGTASDGHSYAFRRGNVSAPLYIRNNIFANFRSGGSGKHYGIATENTTDWNNSFVQSNAYYSVNNSTIGLWGASDVDFETWISNTGEDDLYLSTDQQPYFIDAANADLHLDVSDACAFNGIGEVIAGITQDWDGDIRHATYPDMGIDEFTPTGGNNRDVWRGRQDTDWDVAFNWGCELAPLNSSDLIVPQSINNPLIDRSLPAATVVCNDLTIRDGGQLSVNPENSLTVSNNLTIDGELILETPKNSGAGGSLIVNGTLTQGTTGNSVFKRFIPLNEWHYIAPPVHGQTTEQFTNTPNGWNANLMVYNEAYDGDNSNNWDNYASAWQYAHGGQGSPQAMNIGTGYAYYYNGYESWSFEGEFNNAATSIPVTYTANDIVAKDGWNLIANPFPSALDWGNTDAGWDRSPIDNVIYFYDHSYPNGTATYRYYGAGTVFGDGTSIPPVTVNGATQYIPAGQAFFVHANSTATVDIPSSARVHNTQVFWKKQTDTQDQIEQIRLAVQLADINREALRDEHLIRFVPTSTDGYDGRFDAYKMYAASDSLPQLYSISPTNGTDLAINSLPNYDGNLVIPLGLQVKQAAKLKITADMLTVDPEVNVYLIDYQEETLTNLQEVASYEFNCDAGHFKNRLAISFSQRSNDFDIEENDINIYAYDHRLVIRLLALQEGATLSVFNTLGQKVTEQELTNYHTNIDMLNHSGVYIVKVKNGQQSKQQRVYID